MEQNSSHKQTPKLALSSQLADPDENAEMPLAMENQGKQTYGQILKSSAIIGGSSLINIFIGIVRTKIMAVLLGPSGVGLMGLYTSITDLTQSVVGMGINSSGVRQIAAAVGTGDDAKIAKTAQVLRRTAIFLGLLGAVFLLGFAKPLSNLTFGNEQHADGVALLALSILFLMLSSGQAALIQGMRRIADLAKMGVIGSLLGAIISILAVYHLGEDGVALALVLIAAMSFAVSSWYRLKIKLPAYPMTKSEIASEQIDLLKLGVAFMFSGLMVTGAAYVIRMILVRKVGFDAAGLYQSAWALGGMYLGIILQAMGTDFYPRLTAVASDNAECNRIVNEQAHVGMLLAGPGIIGTLTLAPLVIELFYSAKFHGAVEVLRWLCLGMALRVISWPIGFIIVAKGIQSTFIFCELAWTVVYLGLAWLCIERFQLNGAGIAFFGSYIFHIAMIYAVVKRLTNFRYSAECQKTVLLFLVLSAIVFCAPYTLPTIPALAVSAVAIVLSGLSSIQVLLNLVAIDGFPRPILKVLAMCRLTKRTRDDQPHHVNSTQKSFFASLLPDGLPVSLTLSIYGFVGVSCLTMLFYNPLIATDNWTTGAAAISEMLAAISSLFKHF